MKFGRTIQTWRKEKALSQSRAAQHLGVNLDTLQNWEQGRNEPRADYARRAILDRIYGRDCQPKGPGAQRRD